MIKAELLQASKQSLGISSERLGLHLCFVPAALQHWLLLMVAQAVLGFSNTSQNHKEAHGTFKSHLQTMYGKTTEIKVSNSTV